jgi:ribose transport system ATP-binding protein
MNNNEYILELKNIVKRFPGVLALNNVQLQLKKGEVHVLLGENGAGKSTLIKVMTGAYIPEEGEMLLEGNKVEFEGPIHASKLGIGAVYQEFNLVPHLTIAENVYLGKEIYKAKAINMKDMEKMVKESQKYLDMVGAKLNPRKTIATCGVAEQQLVEIAKALASNAKVLILDEPSATLTNEEVEKLFEVIEDLKKKGVTLVYISHRLEEIQRIGDRVTVLRDGTYVETVDIDRENMDKDYLIKLMVGRELKNQFPKHEAKLGEELLKVDNLTRKGVIEDINLTLRRGEILGISGLVGAGRTEIARAIFGADKRDSGDIYICGERVNINSAKDAITHPIGIGLVPEDRKGQGILQLMSVSDNIIMASESKVSKFGVFNKECIKRTVDELIKKLRVKTPTPKQLVGNLSGGNQQKVVLAKWMASGAEIIILDEPTRGIDVGAKVEVYQLMNELVESGVGIIMISSELPELIAMSDRIMVMSEGHMMGELSRDEVDQEKILKLASGGK